MMNKKKLNKIFLLLPLVSLLGSCQIAYSHPITQSAAKDIISSTLARINEKDYKEFSKISFESKLVEERTTSFFNSLFLETIYKFEYVSEPYSLKIDIDSSNKENKELLVESSSILISKTEETYLISIDGDTPVDINQEEYKVYWAFCDFSSYIKTISRKLIKKTDDLINSVGNSTENKENKLVGFQTSSSGNLNLDIAFEGSEFNAKDMFFQDNYNAETATVLAALMNNGLIDKFYSKYAFVVNQTNDYYLAGTYEGKIINTIKYE